MEQQRSNKKARLEGNDLQRRREQVVRRIKSGTVSFRRLPEELRDDAEIALAAIHKDRWWNGEAVSGRLKSNKKFVLEAVKVWGCFLQFAPEKLRGDRDVVLEAVRNDDGQKIFLVDSVTKRRPDGSALQYAAEELRGNREVVLEAVQQEGDALAHASKELRANPEIVLGAIRQNGLALRFASEELRGNRGICFTAVQQNGMALLCASVEIRGDHEIVLAAVQQTGIALLHASEELRAEREIVLAAVQVTGSALRFASIQLRGNGEVVLAAVQRDGWALRYASEELRDNREIVLAALDGSKEEEVANVLRWVSNDLQNDPMVAGVILLKGGRLRRGSEIMERLENVLLAVRALPEAFVKNVVDEESVVQFSRWWERSIWQRIWMALQLEPPGMQGTGRLFVELLGLPLELQQAKELRYCAPVIGAILSSSLNHKDWKDIRSYRLRDDLS